MATPSPPVLPLPELQGVRVLLVEAPYYTKIADGQREGALSVLRSAGAEVDLRVVGGALELPATIAMAVQAMAQSEGPRWDGFLALGCVIKGETDHYEHVCRESVRGLMDLSVQHALALANGILTVATEAQAIARAGTTEATLPHNKGAEAARALLLQIAHRRAWGLA